MASKSEKIPDFILVVKKDNLPLIDLYLDNLRVLGLDFENKEGETVDLIFIKVYISEESLNHFSQVYSIGVKDTEVTDIFYSEPVYSTPFSNPAANFEPFRQGILTDAEKIMVTHKVLENTKYGEKDKEFGLTKLINQKIIETAYPLHDGPITEDGTNSRSLLQRYWSNGSVAHVQQPLDLIYRYFGTEIAFYFAWLEYFNIMLAIPAVLGALVFLGSLFYVAFGDPIEVREVCVNQETLCPICEDRPGCKFPKIQKFCSLAQWSFVFDNRMTVSFAVFISFWATLFMVIWRRKENKLKFRWDCVTDVRETEIRQAYIDGTTHRRLNSISGEMEPYTPAVKSIFNYSCTIFICIILFAIIAAVIIMNVIFKILFIQMCLSSNSPYLHSNGKVLSMFFFSFFQVCFMKLFQRFYKPASIYLTKFENPKTQFNFDNSVLYKRYLLAFMNNYFPTLYLAFLKGNFITVPHNMSFFRKDTCQPNNCVVALVMQLTFVMTFKTLLGNIVSAVIPYLFRICKYERIFHLPKKSIPQWEEEYYLEPLGRFSVTGEFSEMVIRYGLVIFFSKTFPLAALCALLNNLIELRSDAYKFVKTHRRPVPVEKSGIGAWNGILRSLSYLGTAINAFIIAFTSDWIDKEIYRTNKGEGNLIGYVNSTFSKYATADYKQYNKIPNAPEYCYFRGKYSPPESADKYTLTETYWMHFTFKFVTVFVFEHIVFMCNAILSYCIPYEPESVKLQLTLNLHKARNDSLKECEKKLEKLLPKDLDLSKLARIDAITDKHSSVPKSNSSK